MSDLEHEIAGLALFNQQIHRRRFLALVGLAGGAGAVIAFLEACGASSTPTSTSTSHTVLNDIFGPGGTSAGQGVSLSLGMALAMTGPGAFYGKVMSQGAHLASKQILASGGPNINIHIIDHNNGDVPTGVTGLHQLISQNQISYLATSYGGVSEAFVPIVQQNRIPMFNGGGPSPKQLFQDYVWATRLVYGYDYTPAALTWLTMQNPNAQRLAVIGIKENGYEATHILAPQFWKTLRPTGQMVAEEYVANNSTDFSGPIARLKASKPDVIMANLASPDYAYFLKQLRESNVKVPAIGFDLQTEMLKIAGTWAGDLVACADFFDTQNLNPLGTYFVTEYTAAYGAAPEILAANYYDITLMAWQLMQRVIKSGGSPTSGQALENALVANLTVKSVIGGNATTVGEMQFDPQSHTAKKPLGVFGVKNGAIVKLLDAPTSLIPSKDALKP